MLLLPPTTIYYYQPLTKRFSLLFFNFGTQCHTQFDARLKSLNLLCTSLLYYILRCLILLTEAPSLLILPLYR